MGLNTFGKAFFDVTPELLIEVLGLPKDAILTGAEWRFDQDAVRFYVRHSDLPPCPEGAKPQQVTWRSEWVEDTTPDRLFIGWKVEEMSVWD